MLAVLLLVIFGYAANFTVDTLRVTVSDDGSTVTDISYDGTAFASVLSSGIRGRQDRWGRILGAANEESVQILRDGGKEIIVLPEAEGRFRSMIVITGHH